MSKYTTGEIAKLCGVTVRTVQYYDSRNILIPSELSEGGRRLYSEEDLKQMKIICFLRDLGLSINSIGELLSEEDPGSIIFLLLEQQKKVLLEEIGEGKSRLEKLEEMERGLHAVERFSVESIGDIVYKMKTRKKLTRLRGKLLAVGILLDIAGVSAAAVWVLKGIWQPFIIWLCIDIVIGLWVSFDYTKRVVYICPKCHHVFKAGYREALFSKHTPNTRKLTCPGCGHKGFCVEAYDGEENK